MATLTTARAARFGTKPVRYVMVSVVSVAVSQTVLVVCNAVLGWDAVPSNLMAVSVGCIPSYLLNRYWTWGKRGPNHFWREVVPFWSLALIGLALSTLFVWLAEQWNDATWAISAASFAAFGLLWTAKYVILNQLLFKVEYDNVRSDDVKVLA